jgi:hypothetical protein
MLEPPGPSGELSPMPQEEEEEREERERRGRASAREKKELVSVSSLRKKEVKAGLRILEEWRNQGLGSSFSCW